MRRDGKHPNKPDGPTTRPRLLLHGLFQLIGDGVAYSLAKKCRPTMVRKNFDLAYENLSIDHLHTVLQSQSKFEPFVVLSIGSFDQKLFLKTRRRPKFGRKFRAIVDHLFSNGAQKIVGILPFPEPLIGFYDIKAWEVYERVLNIYSRIAEEQPSKFLMLDYNHLISSKTDSNSGVFYQKEGDWTPNIALKKTKLGLTHNCKVVMNPNLINPVYHQLRKIANELKQIPEARPSNEPKTLKSALKPTGVASKPVGMEGDASANPNKSVRFSNASTPRVLTLEAIDAKIKSSTQTSKGTKMGRESKHHASVNQGRSRVLNLIFHVGVHQYYGLIDTGADQSVVDARFANDLKSVPGIVVETYELASPIKIIVGDGAVLTLDSVLLLEVLVKPINIAYRLMLVVVPGLVEKVIFGNDFFLAVGAQINYEPPSLKFLVDGQHMAVDIAYGPIDDDPLTGADRDKIRQLNVFVNLNVPFSFKESLHVPTLAEWEMVERKLRKALVPGIEAGIITPAQGEQAVKELAEYAPMWVNPNPRYKGELVKLPIKDHLPLKPRRYSVPKEKKQLAHDAISDWFKKGWVIRGETEYVHPLALVQKKNGKTRVCVDATGLNRVLESAHNNPPKIENLLFEPNHGHIYSVLDFSEGFMQIPLASESYKYLGFEFDGQIYLMTRLAFGTSISSSVFNRCARTVIYGDEISHPDIRVYVDDVKIESNSFENHLASITQVIERVAKAGMALSLDKITLFEPSINYLGFNLKKGVITKGPKYKIFFEEFARSHVTQDEIEFSNKREVQRLLGFVNWYSLFVPGHTELIEPFQKLLSKNPPYKIDSVAPLHALKQMIELDIELMQPLSNQPFYIYVETMPDHLAACIYQRNELGRPFIITLANHRFQCAIRPKSDEIKKLYSIYFILKRYKDLLFGRKVVLGRNIRTIISNNREAIYLSPMLGKWLTLIQCFEIVFIENTPEPKKLLEFLIKYEMLPLTGNSEVGNSLEGQVGLLEDPIEQPSPVVRAQLARLSVLKLSETEYADTITSLAKNLVAHQKNDIFCQKITKAMDSRDEVTAQNYEVREDCLYKKVDEHALPVLPAHVQLEVIMAFHELFLHPGVNKTQAVTQRHFWGDSLAKNVRLIVGNCTRCRTSKISNTKVVPARAHIEAQAPGEIVAIDMYGPLPKCPGGTMALLVAIDIHSGYVVAAPLKDTKTDAFVTATKKIIKELAKTKTVVKRLLSDNGKQFRAKKYLEWCGEQGIKKIFTTTYNPQGNPAERVMRDLGDKFRLIFNSKDSEVMDHTTWAEHVKKINFALNHTPKAHGYTPAEILGVESFAPLQRQKLLPRVRRPEESIKKEITKMVTNSKSYTPSLANRSKPSEFRFDASGYVHVWTDAATRRQDGEILATAVGFWFAPGHPGNHATVLHPPIKNNAAEVMAAKMAVAHLIQNRIYKIHLVTDSQYLADLYNGKYLHKDNPSIYSYENYDELEFFVGLPEVVRVKGWGNFDLKISHCPGHSIDFGNLEVDWEVGWVVDKYIALDQILKSPSGEMIKLQKFIYTVRHFRLLKQDHLWALQNTRSSNFQEGDVVSVKSHPLSAAGYGITAKFMPRYNGEYMIVGRLSDNTYFLKDVRDPNATILTANVRQLQLVRRGQVESASEEEGADDPVSNLNLFALWKQERAYDPKRVQEAEQALSQGPGEFPMFNKELQPI